MQTHDQDAGRDGGDDLDQSGDTRLADRQTVVLQRFGRRHAIQRRRIVVVHAGIAGVYRLSAPPQYLFSTPLRIRSRRLRSAARKVIQTHQRPG